MEYKELVNEYFKSNEKGTIRDIKYFIKNKFFQKFKDEQYADWLKTRYSVFGNRPWDFDLRAERKIMECESLSKHMIKRMNDREFTGEKGKDGRWVYKLNTSLKLSTNKSQEVKK